MYPTKDHITSWWEQKRLLFNTIILLIILYELNTSDRFMNQAIHKIDLFTKLTVALFTVLAANLPYCMGTGISSTLARMTKRVYNYQNWIIFVFGLMAFWFFIRLKY